MEKSKFKYAVCSPAYNERDIIGACIKNWRGVIDKHLVLVSSKPWNGSPREDDGTARYAKELGAEVIVGEWKSEAEQRTWGLARLYDYDYVLIVDPDELYTKSDQQKIIHALDNPIDKGYHPHTRVPAFRCPQMKTYWKTGEYVLNPPDNHKPIIAVDPKRIYCHEHRQFKYLCDGADYLDYAPFIDVVCYHMSWVKTDRKVLEKINSYSHYDAIRPNWYHDVWLGWKPGSAMEVRPYGEEPSVATYDPAPPEIMDLLQNN